MSIREDTANGTEASGPQTMAASHPRSEFFAPLPLAMVALMVLNDRYLKATFHNELTGKLSDVAVCVFMPLYVSDCVRLVARFVRPLAFLGAPRVRLSIGCWFVALFYTALEIVPPVTDAALWALRAVGPWLGITREFGLTKDWTDLSTLLLIPLAYVYGLRRLELRSAHQSEPNPSATG